MAVLLRAGTAASLPEDPRVLLPSRPQFVLRLASIFPPGVPCYARELRPRASRMGSLPYLFEDCVLDTDRRELRRGTALVAVEPQVFDLLVHLVRHRDRVVSKDELLATVWHGRIVSESALFNRINAARSAHRRHRRRTAADQDIAAQGPSLRRRCARGRGGHRSRRANTPAGACRHWRYPIVPRSRCCPSPI